MASSISRNDWYQTVSTVIISIYTKDKTIDHESVIIHRSGRNLLVTVLIGEFTYSLHVGEFKFVIRPVASYITLMFQVLIPLETKLFQQWVLLGVCLR